jgi:ribose/xylose/arabinose/galactoside ABC-type transport system permease subunit
LQVQSFYVQIITGVALIIAVVFGRLSQVLSR